MPSSNIPNIRPQIDLNRFMSILSKKSSSSTSSCSCWTAVMSSSLFAVNRCHVICHKENIHDILLFNRFAMTEVTALLPKSAVPWFPRLTHVLCLINRPEGSFLFFPSCPSSSSSSRRQSQSSAAAVVFCITLGRCINLNAPESRGDLPRFPQL